MILEQKSCCYDGAKFDRRGMGFIDNGQILLTVIKKAVFKWLVEAQGEKKEKIWINGLYSCFDYRGSRDANGNTK